MKLPRTLLLPIACLLGLLLVATSAAHAQVDAQQIAFAGLRAVAGKGQFNGIRSDSSGNLYLLLDQKDGVRVLKSDPSATQVLAEARIGSGGDIGAALALDPAGNVYVTGTTTSATIPTTAGAPFASPSDSSTNGFVAKFDPDLNLLFATYTGSGRMAPAAIAATGDRVFIAGSIYASTLPVTASAVIRQPASGSAGNGFVESFSADGTALLYATYLSGFGGDTTADALAADAADNAYIAGYTTASGYPTVAAVVPQSTATGSGFLTRLTAAGDGLTFSTFIPGTGITSLALNEPTQTLIFSGGIAPGLFPITSVSMPIASTDYQTAVRMSLDGSRVIASTLLAPATRSVVASAPDGTIWAATDLTVPLLPVPSISSVGSSAGFHISAQGTVDRNIRFGGSTTLTSTIPVAINAIAFDPGGNPIFAGFAAPTTSSSLLATETYDLPLVNSPSALLPSTVRDAALPPGSNCGSMCAGSGAYLAKLSLTAGPSLALSTDALPNIVLRNLGSAAATNLQIGASGFTFSTNCPSQLDAGAECSLVLTGGPGALTVGSANASSQTLSLPAASRSSSALVYAPHEVGFGIMPESDPPVSHSIAVSNLGTAALATPLPVSFSPNPNAAISLTGDCPGWGSSQPLQPGTSCHLVVQASAPSTLTAPSPFQITWSSGASSISLTGFTETNDLHISSTGIDFGTQFLGGLRLPRYLYLSNNSATAISHSPVALPGSSPFTVADRCPTVLEAHTVCQIQLDYSSPQTSSDAVTLSLDQGFQVLVTGKTLPRPGTSGETVNPNLVISPTSLGFSNPVVVTGTSAGTLTATVSNTGAQPFPISIGTTGDFIDATNCTGSLAAGASCSVVVTFTPSQPGTRYGLISVSTGAASTPAYINLSGTALPLLPANNGSLDLGSTPVGQPIVAWYKIAEPLSRLAANASGDFKVLLAEDIGYGHGQPSPWDFTSSATGSCMNCWLGVQFLPSIAGARQGSLSLTSTSSGAAYTVALDGNGLPLSGLLLTPSQQDFGPVAVHSSSASALFSLTNLTASSVTFATPSVSGDFTIRNDVSGGPSCIGAVASGASCFVEIAFAPTATGPAAGTLVLASDGGTAHATLTGYGSPDTGLSLNPAALVFANVPSPSATRQTIAVTNTGTYDLLIGAPSSSTSAFQTSTTCGTLAIGTSCTITVTFQPQSAQAMATLSIPVTSSAPGAPQTTYSVPLSGSYTTGNSGLQILPVLSDFGPTTVDTSGIARQLLVNNLTAQPVSLELALPRQFSLAGQPCTALSGGGSCALSLAFTPLTNGEVTGTITAHGTPAGGGPQISGLGYVKGFGAGQASLAITGDLQPGDIVAFGQVPSGQTSVRTLSVTNNGTGLLTVRRVTSQWPFLSTTTCGSPLSAGQSCTINITYSPINQVLTGSSPAPFNADSGTVVLESDAASSPQLIQLTGTVTPQFVTVPLNTAPVYAYTISEGSLHFDATRAGEASPPQTINLSNTGSRTIHVTGLRIAPDFSVSGDCSTIIPGASCPLQVAFTPQASSSRATSTILGALGIVSDSGTSLDFVSLSGTATPATLGISPASLDFGQVLVGVSSTLQSVITNYDSSPATLRSIAASGDYSLQSNCPAPGAQLTPSASCTLKITFHPSQVGVRNGVVAISSSLTTLPLSIGLTGTGVQPHLLVTPSSLSFGDIPLGRSSSLAVSITNTGTATLTGIAALTTGDYAVQKPCASTTLAPGARCDLAIVFAPSAAGSRTGSLRITSSDPASPLAIALTGNGMASPSFAFTVDGTSASTLSITSGQSAGYHLSVTPRNGFTGAIVLNCIPVQAAQYATCSLLPSAVNLTGASAQTSTATLNTVMKVTAASSSGSSLAAQWAMLLLPLGSLFAQRRRVTRVIVLLLIGGAMAGFSGCGSGGTVVIRQDDPNLRSTPPGTYRYSVTATALNGVAISQTVALTLVVTKP